MESSDNELHLDVYEDRSILHYGDEVSVFSEGKQSDEARARYDAITSALSDGFLEDTLTAVRREGLKDSLTDDDKALLLNFADAVTSNAGRALVAVGIQQLAIKAICPEQSVRLHKASNQRNSFSWTEGISMRSIDSSYVTPFLRESGLLKLNASGAFMTRTFAENYPFSRLYKANFQGPRLQWMELVDRLENGTIDALAALEFILAFLQNKSDEFAGKCDDALAALNEAQGITMEKVERAVKAFLRDTEYPARAFEIALHSFMQALIDLHYASNNLEPLSQMRSANKKHGNVGDIETHEGADILESWDAKYKKPYLIDELSELEDKLETAPRVMSAGFVTDGQPDLTSDVIAKQSDIESEYDTEVKIFSLHDWIDYQIDLNYVSDRDALGSAWLTALTESLTLQRVERAPIDEPCETWVEDLTKVIKRSFK
jgi:hypothetical protein